MRRASRSRESTIQAGKSTFTRFGSVPMRRALVRSSWSIIFSAASNLRSNVLAFINLYLLIARSPYRNNAHVVAAPGDHGRPVFLIHLTDHYPPQLIADARRDFQQYWIRPKRLSLLEIDAVLSLVLGALFRVVLEAHSVLLPHWRGIIKVYLIYQHLRDNTEIAARELMVARQLRVGKRPFDTAQTCWLLHYRSQPWKQLRTLPVSVHPGIRAKSLARRCLLSSKRSGQFAFDCSSQFGDANLPCSTWPSTANFEPVTSLA